MYIRMIMFISVFTTITLYSMEEIDKSKTNLLEFDPNSVTYTQRDGYENYVADLVDLNHYSLINVVAKKKITTGTIEYYEIRPLCLVSYYKKNDPALFNALKDAYDAKEKSNAEEKKKSKKSLLSKMVPPYFKKIRKHGKSS